MTDTGYKYPSLTAHFSDVALPNRDNLIGAPDETYAGATDVSSSAVAYLLYNSQIISSNKLFSLPLTTPGDVIHGDSTDLWAATLSPTIINDSSFGIYFSMSYGVQYSVSIVYTYNFNVPSDATINGIEVVFRGYYTSFKARATSYYDSIGVKVYYTEGGSSGATHEGEATLSSLSYLRTKKA